MIESSSIPITRLNKFMLIIEKFVEKFKIYFAYFKIRFMNEIQYRIAALAGILTQFAWGAMYIMLYTAFLSNGTSDSYTIEQMSTYIWLQQAFLLLFHMYVDREILEQCRDGGIAMELVKPVDLYSIWHARVLGRKLAVVLLRATPLIIICSLPMLGQYRIIPPSSIATFLFFILTLVLSALVLMSYSMIMYAIVMRNITFKGIAVTFRIINEACSGLLIPITFMPDFIIKILQFTPFYYMQNAPYNIYIGAINAPNEILKIVLIQIIWIVVLTFMGRNILRKQLRKVVVQGG